MSLSKPHNLASTGYVFLALSTLFFFFQLYFVPIDTFVDLAGLFWGNYLASVGYFFAFVITHKRQHGWWNWRMLDEKIYSIALALFSISAHALNYTTEIRIFAPYVSWMVGYMLLLHGAILLFPYREKLPNWLQYAVYFVSGAGIVLTAYLTIFIAPVMAFSLIGFFVFGLSLHSFIPLWFLVYFIFVGIRKIDLPYSRTAFWSGITLPVIILAIFLVRWQDVQSDIEASQVEYELKYQDEYPEWVALSQRLPDDPLTESVILSNVRTQRSFWQQSGMMARRRVRGFEQQHDPLAVTANLLYGPLRFRSETLIPLLNSQYDARHQTHRRLWRGDDLVTSQVQTNIQAWPEFRLAYIEKTLTIHHEDTPQSSGWRLWRNQQEAVYSFYLPEGAVATSLSLWIDGKEEKARLTTKSKADSAYSTIVGVEVRDPALLHWQEGNRLSVTVFPCTPDEDRMVKIGFTMPIRYDDNKLLLENVPFDGPSPSDASETIRLQIEGESPADLDISGSWRKVHDQLYEYEGEYYPDWKLEWTAPPLSEGTFSFQGNQYSVEPSQFIMKDFRPAAIILDINDSWSSRQIQETWDITKEYPVYAFLPEPVRLTESNFESVVEQLQRCRFSLIPFHRIEDPEHTLIISRNPENSPQLEDLGNSDFAENMRKFLFMSSNQIKWFNLGDESVAYAQALRDFRVISYHAGTIDELDTLLKNEHFPTAQEDDRHIQIASAGITLIETTSTTQGSTAPDHLKRLFAYNSLLREIGPNFYDRKALEETWIRQAEEAFVVSPVSSLVVLESQKDYERFGIEENENTLGNAGINNSGAIPEPHEWALILMVVLTIGVYLKRW